MDSLWDLSLLQCSSLAVHVQCSCSSTPSVHCSCSSPPASLLLHGANTMGHKWWSTASWFDRTNNDQSFAPLHGSRKDRLTIVAPCTFHKGPTVATLKYRATLAQWPHKITPEHDLTSQWFVNQCFIFYMFLKISTLFTQDICTLKSNPCNQTLIAISSEDHFLQKLNAYQLPPSSSWPSS